MLSMMQTAQQSKEVIDMYFVKPRCGRCGKVLRPDRTCQNPDCSRFVDEKDEETQPNEETESKKK